MRRRAALPLRAVLLCACAATARCVLTAAAEALPLQPLLPTADAPHVVVAAAAATWHPHRYHHDAVAHPHTVLTGPEATASSLVLRPDEPAGAAPAAAAGGGKARTGLAPEGVSVEAALASAVKLQPGARAPPPCACSRAADADVCACFMRRRAVWRAAGCLLGGL
jgi:hypothetical protein